MPPSRTKTERLPRSQRRAQLVAISRDVFVEHGYHAASMDEIAERAGVSKPVLYQHFPSKLSLYTALVEEACDEVITAIRAALTSTTDNHARVLATIKVWYDYVTEEGQAFRLVFESDLTNDPNIRELLDRVNNESASAIAAVIAEDTNISNDAALLLAASLVGGGHVSARTWISSDSSLSKDEAVALASTLLWRGIAGFPKSVSTDTAD